MSRFLRASGATLVSAVLVPLGVTGCGGGGPTESPSMTVTTTTTSHPRSAADERIARYAQLKLSDFPSGWEQQDRKDSKSKSKCPAVKAAEVSRSARQPSPTFAIGDGTQADAAVYIFHDVSQAQRMFSHISGEGNRTCLAEEVTKFVESNPRKGVKFGKVTSGQVSMRPVGDESALGRFTLPITDTSTGLNVDAYFDLVFARENRGIAILSFLDTATPFDEALRGRLTRILVTRLKAGLESDTSGGTSG